MTQNLNSRHPSNLKKSNAYFGAQNNMILLDHQELYMQQMNMTATEHTLASTEAK